MRLTTVTCCYFKKYVEREIAKATGVSYYKPFQGWREKRRKTWHYTANRPWTDAAKQENAPNEKPKKVLVEPIKEWKIFKGDRMAFSTASSASAIPEGVLLGLGNPLLDISVEADNKLLDKYGLLPNNAIIAEEKHHAIYDEMVKNYHPQFIAGGATQNSIRVAQWLLQSPKSTTFMGGVGDDKFGSILKEKAEQVGVEVCFQVHSGVKTGICGAVITNEDRSLVTELGAAEKFDVEFMKNNDVWKFIEKANFYYIGGFFLTVCPEAVKMILHHAAETRKTVIMNLHATFLCKLFADPELDLMPYVDIVFGNGDEAVEFSKCHNFQTDDLKEIAEKTVELPKKNSSRKRVAVFTQGRDPTVLGQSGKVTEYPITPIEHSLIKDTNGCGDSFVGGFLSQLVQGKELSECMRCGFYAAKVVIQHDGCTYPEKPDFH